MKKNTTVKFAVLTAMALLMITLAGCGKGGIGTKTIEDVSQDSRVALSVMCLYCFNGQLTDDIPFYQHLKEKLNLSLTISSPPNNNYLETLNISIATGELADIFISPGSNYQALIREGVLLPLSDYAPQYPNLAKRLNKFDILKPFGFGKMYELPITKYSGAVESLINDHTIYYRKDWLDKLGLPVPKSIDEFYQVAKAFAVGDPDGNGVNDTYGLTLSEGGIWWLYPIFNAFETSAWARFKQADGKWVPEIISNEMKEALTFIKKMYDEKILDPESVINTPSKKIEKFVGGKAGIIFEKGGNNYNQLYDKFIQDDKDKDPKSLMVYSPTGTGLRSRSGKTRIDGFLNFYMVTHINNNISEEKKKKALELLDYLSSDEALDFMRWGMENVPYKREGNKKINSIPPAAAGTVQFSPTIDDSASLKAMITWDGNFIPPNTPNQEEVLGSTSYGMNHTTDDPLFGVIPDETRFPQELTIILNSYLNEAFIYLITKSTNFNKDWNEFVQTWLNKGGQIMIDEMNLAAKEYGK